MENLWLWLWRRIITTFKTSHGVKNPRDFTASWHTSILQVRGRNMFQHTFLVSMSYSQSICSQVYTDCPQSGQMVQVGNRLGSMSFQGGSSLWRRKDGALQSPPRCQQHLTERFHFCFCIAQRCHSAVFQRRTKAAASPL